MAIDVGQLGQRLQRLRELQGQSLSGLASSADISKSYLAKLERGEVENPGLQTLHSIARTLQVTLADLLASSDDTVAGQSSSGSRIEDYERLLADLPSTLRTFLAEKEQQGDKLPADTVRALAAVQYRGKRPKTTADWRFLYDAMRRSI